MYSYEALQILIFLIPGFVASKVKNVLLSTEVEKEFDKIIEALIFSLVIYTFYSLLSGKSPVSFDKEKTILSYDGYSLLLLGLLSIAVPCVLGLLETNKWFLNLARKIRISSDKARSDVWFDSLGDVGEKGVIINLEGGKRIHGWVGYYSNTPEDAYIYLHDPAWVDMEEFVPLKVKGILLTPAQKIESIEIM